jgi:hypothetical protein
MPRLTVPGKNENRHLIRESHSILCCRGLYVASLELFHSTPRESAEKVAGYAHSTPYRQIRQIC